MKLEKINDAKFRKLSIDELKKTSGGRKKLTITEIYGTEVDCPDYLGANSRCFEVHSIEHWANVNIFGTVTDTWKVYD